MPNPLAELKQEWPNLKKSPYSFVLLVVVAGGLGFSMARLYLNDQIAAVHEQISAKESQLGRYRVALGIDPASKGALVELNNQELALKAQSIVVQLRQFTSIVTAKCTAIDQRAKSGEIKKEDVGTEKFAAMKEVSQAFVRTLASDTYNVEHELRNRMDASAMEHVIRVPAFM